MASPVAHVFAAKLFQKAIFCMDRAPLSRALAGDLVRTIPVSFYEKKQSAFDPALQLG